MNIIVVRKTLSLSVLILLSGCAGYDRAILVTKTNVGLDIDSTPPTAEITIARRELAIQPTFPDRSINDKNLSGASTASNTAANSQTKENLSQSQNTLSNQNIKTPDDKTQPNAGIASSTAANSQTKENLSQSQNTLPTQNIKTPEDKIQPAALTASNTVTNGQTEENLSESQNTLPLLASFGLQGGFFNPRITGYFAGGDAAVSLVGGDLKKEDSSICLKNKPEDMRSFPRKLWDFMSSKNENKAIAEAQSAPRPFYFATDTAFGLKVAWTGTGGPYPDTLKLGYNRKEFASAPVFIYEGCEAKKVGNWKVKLPSFLASIDNDNEIGLFENSGIKHVQFFATGRAATEFAKKPSVQQVALEGMSPAVAALDSSELHQYLFLQIKEAFNKANDDTKKAVLNKAISNDLIPKTTTSDDFISALKENKYLSPQRLYSIKQLFDLPQ